MAYDSGGQPMSDRSLDFQAAVLEEMRSQTRILRLLLERRGGAQDFITAQLFRAIYAAFGDRPFDSGELICFARENLRTRAALRHALEEIVDDLGNNGASKSLGKFLQARFLDGGADGLRLQRVGTKRPTIWRLCDFESRDSQNAHSWP